MRILRWFSRFFVWLFATVGAVVMIGGIVAAVIAVSRPAPELPSRMILSLDLSGGIVDTRDDDPWEQLGGDPPNYLRRIVDSIIAAKDDPRVLGLALRLHGDRLKLAHVQELRDAISKFKASGKWSTAHAATFSGVADYLAAASTGAVSMRPSGTVGVTGVALAFPHIRDTLETIGVEAQIEQRHEFKSAAETFTRSQMSEPARLSWGAIANSWFGQIVSLMASDRNMSEAQVRAVIDGAPHLGEDGLKNGLVDTLQYWDQFAAKQRNRDGEAALFVSVASYAAALEDVAQEDGSDGERTKIALIHGAGPVVDSRNDAELGQDVLAADRIAAAIRKIAKDETIDGLILRIDSPGGGYGASDSVRRAVKLARESGKSVVASLGAVAASGGYFIAMGADRIVAQPATLTGSIGVFGGKMVLSELWRKLGVNWSQIRVGAQAGMWSPHWPFEPGAQARRKAILDHIYNDFAAKAAADRDLDKAGIDAAARGRVWTGEDALGIGLVDRLGGLSTAVTEMKLVLGLKDDAPIVLVARPAPRSPFERVLEIVKDGGSPFTAVRSLMASIRTGTAWPGWVGRAMGGLSGQEGVLQLPPYQSSL
jgi:protease-4